MSPSPLPALASPGRLRQLWLPAVLLAAAIVVVVSLYLPWQEASCLTGGGASVPGSHASVSLPNLFTCSYDHIDGRSTVGDVAALSALLPALAAAAAFFWPRARVRVPVAVLALPLAYFTLAVAAETRLESRQEAREFSVAAGSTGAPHFHVAYGMYAGLAAAALGLLGAGLAGRTALTVCPPLRRLGAAGLGIGLLVALLLPWERAGLPASVSLSELGIADPSGAIAAVLALRVVVASWSKAGLRPFELAGPALGALLFAGAAWTLGLDAVHAHAAWMGLAIAALLAVVTVTDRALVRTISPPRASGTAVLIAGTALVTSLFLPWQTACYGHTSDLKTLGLAGRCVSTNGFSLVGATAAVLTIALVVALLSRRAARSLSTLELAVGLGLLVATLGFRLETGTRSGVRLGLGSGSYVGFAACAFLAGLVMSQSTWRRRDLKAAVPSLLPIALGGAFVAAVVVPWWGILPNQVWSVFVPGLAAVSWLTVVSALLAVRIVHLWIRQVAGAPEQARELVLLSVAVVVLAVLDAVPLPTVQLTWNSGVLLGLSLPLALLALIRERGGLRSLQVPEILRIDRI